MYTQRVANWVKIGWQVHNDNHGLLTHPSFLAALKRRLPPEFQLKFIAKKTSMIAWQCMAKKGLTENRVPIPSTVYFFWKSSCSYFELAILEGMPFFVRATPKYQINCRISQYVHHMTKSQIDHDRKFFFGIYWRLKYILMSTPDFAKPWFIN